MSGSDVDRAQRERLEANTRYNGALTALDRAIVARSGRPLAREDFDALATALIVFLQQITGFVETSDRQIAAEINARVEQLDAALASAAELRVQMNVLKRVVQAVRRERTAAAPDDDETVVNSPGIGNSPHAASDTTYLAFEDEFRGSAESVAARVGAYVPIFRGTPPVVDLGCGRGEFLAALKAAGIEAAGVDANAEMAAAAREQGLDVVAGDALAYLHARGDESIGGIIATQVVEHLDPSYLLRLLDTAARKMRTGAPIVIETINPACWLAFFSSYIRDFTHVRPVHPDTLQYLLRASGFERVELRYSAPVPDHMKMKTVDLPAAVLSSSEPLAAAVAGVAHTINANAVVLNNLMFTHMDYAAIGYRS
jgi:SAM-dependent methyltransferase